jgi:hypothetical protein
MPQLACRRQSGSFDMSAKFRFERNAAYSFDALPA